MKRIILANIILILILAACAAPTAPNATASVPATAATSASQQQAAKVTATSEVNYPPPQVTETAGPVITPTLEPTEATTPTAYPGPEIPTQATFSPLPDTTRYGVAKVDAILDVLMSGKTDAFPALIVYASDPCTTKEGLGGPPPCVGDEKDGTAVDVLATMGPQGSFLRKSNDILVDLPGNVEIMGVFSVKADFKSEQYYPAGKYGIVLHYKNTFNVLCLRVTDDGIVRVDYLHAMPDNTNQPDLDAFLKPKS